MPQFDNKEIIKRLLESTIGVISRRTSEAYANVIVGRAINELSAYYDFLKGIEIKGTEYKEIYDLIKIDDSLDQVRSSRIGDAAGDFIRKISNIMGKNAGYYFIKEIKEDLPAKHEEKIKSLGVDLDLIQSEFISEVKESKLYDLDNYDIVKYIITLVFEVLEGEEGRNSAYKNLDEQVRRLSTEYEVLNYIKINDIRSIQGVEIVNIDKKIDLVDSQEVGFALQKFIQEINRSHEQKNDYSFIDKLKDRLIAEYMVKLRDIGVNLDLIKLSQGLITKHVLKALVNVLSDYSTQSYSVLVVNNVLKKLDDKFGFLKDIKIDGLKYQDDSNSIDLPEDIESIRASHLGRALQKIIENVFSSLGEDAGKNFLEKFRKNLGKAYLIRIEEIGVNLHMIELKQDLLW